MDCESISALIRSMKPLDFDFLKAKLFKEWFDLTKVRAKGSYKCLLTFECAEYVEATLSDGRELLLNHFDDVRR